ncbi:MAG: gliding motility-associated C-terminal domain-containing protein [Janthinobacterium lividum]
MSHPELFAMLRFYPVFLVARRAARLTQARCGWLAALLLWVLAAPAAQATHIVGGEMDLQYVRGNTYQLTLNLYFDAVNGSPGALDTDLTAGIFDKSTNQRMASVLLPLVSNTFVNYTNPTCAIGSLSTRQLIYRANIELPGDKYNGPQGYYAAVERCCRNIIIKNITAPQNAAQTFYMEFPAVVRNNEPFRDSTPHIFPALADYACLGELFYYDFAGQDPDGDSLVYDLVTPLNGHATPADPKPTTAAASPYSLVNWAFDPIANKPYSTAYQIPGTPTLTIDAHTGRLTVRPTQQDLFVFGVRCQEFRKGEKIGETRRDFQLLVVACAKNQAPSAQLLPAATTRPVYRPGRDTLRLAPGKPSCVRVRYTDVEANSQLSLSLLPVRYTGTLPTFTTATSGTVHAAGQPDTLTATLCFPNCLDTKGKVAQLDIIVADRGCPLPKHDTIHVLLTAIPVPNGLPTLTSTAGPTFPLHVKPGQTLTFDLLATDPDADPLTIVLSGNNGFSPASLGATLTLQPQSGTQRPGRFNWVVPCAAITTPPGQMREIVLTASATTPCGLVQVAPPVVVPVVVDYSNQPPVLTSTLPPDVNGQPPIIRLPLGVPYSATLAGTDADPDVLTLTATGDNFSLPAVGMTFTATAPAAGRADGTFTWLPTCEGASVVGGNPRQLKVTFLLQENTCQPQPQARTVIFEVLKPPAPDFTPPNIITPNGDDKNQYFALEKLPPDFCDLRFAGVKIFSRWGREVYSSPDRTFRWSGEGLAGLYYYLVTYTTGQRYKGWIEVQP